MKAKATLDGSEPKVGNDLPDLARSDALARAIEYHQAFGNGRGVQGVIETAKTFYEFLAGK